MLHIRLCEGETKQHIYCALYLRGGPDAGVVDPEVVAGDDPVPVEDVQPPLHHLHQPPVLARPREVSGLLQPGHRGHVPAVREHGEAEQHQRGRGEGGAGEVVHRHQLHTQHGEGRLQPHTVQPLQGTFSSP